MIKNLQKQYLNALQYIFFYFPYTDQKNANNKYRQQM